jgi:hypothetical protein
VSYLLIVNERLFAMAGNRRLEDILNAIGERLRHLADTVLGPQPAEPKPIPVRVRTPPRRTER